MTETMTTSPNALYVGDHMRCSLYGWTGDQEKYPETAFLVRVAGFQKSRLTREEWVRIEAVDRSDDPFVDNEWTVPFSWLRRIPAIH